MIPSDAVRGHLDRTLYSTHLKGVGTLIAGKVRDCYVGEGRRVLVTTDRISAFDRVLGTIPFKGQILSQLAQFWFEKSRAVAGNHLVAAPDPQAVVATECKALQVEFIVRGYVTGVTSTSLWTAYAAGERNFCGHALPDGLKKNQKLPAPIVTPTTKAAAGAHDQNMSRDQLVALGYIDGATFDRAAALALKMFQFGTDWLAARGLILCDTKYEIGVRPDGELIFIDEIHTPDSSRFWFADDYAVHFAEGRDPRSIDKEFARKWFVDRGYRGDGEPPVMDDGVRVEIAKRYIEAFEKITGKPFVPDWAEPEPRIQRNLTRYFASEHKAAAREE